MKNLLLVVFFVLSGCATNPVHLYDSQKFKGEPSVITSNIDYDLARQLVSEKFGDAPSLAPALIYSVNKEAGSKTFGAAYKVFNSPLDVSYELYVQPGIQRVVVSLDHHMVSPKPKILITFEAVEGHKYSIQHIQKIKLFSTKVKWAPIIIDITSKKVIFPNKIPWMKK